MSKKNNLFFVGKWTLPNGKTVTYEEAEEILTKTLSGSGEKNKEALWSLAQIYRETGRDHDAFECVQKLLKLSRGAEEKASCVLAFGQLMEQKGDYVSAEKYYRNALTLNPTNIDTRYFINNNLGYCLIQQGRFIEAVEYSKAAQDINPSWANAYKNMGLAFHGLGKHSKAAEYFIIATKTCPSDARAIQHLRDLVRVHREIEKDIPDIYEQIEFCKKLVMVMWGCGPDAADPRKKRRQERKKLH